MVIVPLVGHLMLAIRPNFRFNIVELEEMKVPFLFSLCVHSSMILAFVALNQSTITEPRQEIYSSNVSIISLNYFNAIVSKSPIVTDKPLLFHLEKGPKEQQEVGILEVLNERSDLNFDYPSVTLDISVGEEFDAPFLEALSYQPGLFPRENNLTFKKISLSDVKLDKEENSIPVSFFHSNKPREEIFIKPSAILKNFVGKISIDNNLLQSDSKIFTKVNQDILKMENEFFGEIVNKDMRSHRLTNNFPIGQNPVKQRVSDGNSLHSPKKSNDKDLKSSLRDVFSELEREDRNTNPVILEQESLHQGQLVQMNKEKSKQFSTNNSEEEEKELKLWGVSIKKEIYSNLRYPHLAIVKKIGGKVTIQLKVTKEGILKKLKLLKSSGFSILDEEALRATEQAHSFPSAPVSLNHSTYSFSLPIKFEI